MLETVEAGLSRKKNSTKKSNRWGKEEIGKSH